MQQQVTLGENFQRSELCLLHLDLGLPSDLEAWNQMRYWVGISPNVLRKPHMSKSPCEGVVWNLKPWALYLGKQTLWNGTGFCIVNILHLTP